MTDRTHSERYITPIATDFLTVIIPDLMGKAFDSGFKTRVSENKYFQVSLWERSHSAVAIALAVSAIEAHRNRIYYLESKAIAEPPNVISDVVNLFPDTREYSSFPRDILKSVIGELFVIRDVILHSHMYELNVTFNSDNWDMVDFTHEKQKGYGDKKFNQLVDKDCLETDILRLRVLPPKIGFEELFIVLLVYDLLAGLIHKVLQKNYMSRDVNSELDGKWVVKLTELLVYYYNILPNKDFVGRISKLSKRLSVDFSSFFLVGDECFIANTCPRCHSFGFRRSHRLLHCDSCGCHREF